MLGSLMDGNGIDWAYSLALLILGFALILLELFVIPGLNILGVVGFLAAVAGVSFAYAKMGFTAAAIIAAIGLVGTVILVRIMLQMRSWQHLVLHSQTSREAGYNSANPGRDELLGQRGEALTTLRPAGRAQFGEQVIDAVSEGSYIERGMMVEVVKVAGNRVVVHQVTDRN